MFPITALGQNCWLLLYGPNTDDAVQVKARIEVDAQRSLTARQSRRPQAQLLRYKMTWNSVMKMADFATCRLAALDSQDEPILVPFWPASRLVSAAAAMTAGLTIAWTAGYGSYAINPDSLDGYDFFAPLLWCRFTQPPRLTARNGEVARAEFSVTEDAPAVAAVVPPVVADTTFATPDGYAASVFPYTFDPSMDPMVGLAGYDVTRQQLGPGRQQSTVFYPQIPEETLQPTFKFRCSADAIGLLGWWQRRGGGADAFWVPSPQSIALLASDMAIGDQVIPSTAAISTRVGDTLALASTGQAIELGRVNSIAGGTVTLVAGIAAAHAAAVTRVCPASLVRHTDQELSIDFRRADTDWIATAKIAFQEAAFEYNVVDGETRGSTVGRLPTVAWLFQIGLDYSGETQTWYLTTWESGITTPGGQAWEYHDGDFDKLTSSLDLEDDNMTFKIEWWDGCPWENWLPGQLAATGTISVLQAQVAPDGTVSAPVAVWSGNLSTPNRKGEMLEVKVLGANNIFSQMSPNQLMIPSCYKQVYGTKSARSCNLILTNWQFSAVVVSIDGQSVTLGTFAAMGSCAPAGLVDGFPPGFGFLNWFFLGWLQWNNADGQPLRAGITGSTALAGGQITMSLDSVPGFSVGATITAVPGCDRALLTCTAYDAVNNPTGKFNNLPLYGGFGFMPAVSPSFIIPTSTTTAAKK